jgi:tRNA modification GTPase
MGDTIAAIATATGAGGVGIVRISGPDALAIAAGVVGRTLVDRRVEYAVARDERGERIDDVLAFAMVAPRSFTGEDVAELHGHGGAANLGRILRAVLDRGARHAEPGEFTRRAFAAGRIDLARAEGLLAVIEAGSERAWRQAQAQLAGSLGGAIREVDAKVTSALAEIEGGLDFPEDDLEVRGQAWLREELAGAAAACARLAATYAAARVARDGIEVALVGAVNVGKSSLFNALIGRERALVDAAPGTTRDYVEATCEWDGYAVTLIDTAGEREAAGDVEARGIALGRARVEAADVVVVVDDGGAGSGGGGRGAAEAFGRRALRVRSKADLGRADAAAAAAIATSATTGQGVAELRAAIVARVIGTPADAATDVVVTTERQRALLVDAARKLDDAVRALATPTTPLEMVALDVRAARTAIVQVLGEEVGESVLDEVFGRFCIGK